MTQSSPQLHKGIVKQVLSGDCVVIRGQPRGGPPPERPLALSNIVAPKLARRANPNIEGSVETKDEPFAWESREFLRKKLIGKEVLFAVEYKVPGTGREYGCVYLRKADGELDNITEHLVAEGLAEVRRLGIKPSDDQSKLIDLEDQAKSQNKGKWVQDTDHGHVRDIKWSLENPRHFVDQKHNKPVDAIIEMVRDGSTVRAFLLPNFENVTVMLTGIKCPMFKRDAEKDVPEPFAEEAKFFTESRLLQRDVQILLEGVSNQNLLGTVLHPAGNISELLLKEGFAKCVDWSMGVLSNGHEKYRQAERTAKEKQVRIWKGYVSSAPVLNIKDREYSGKVIEVVNADAIVVKLASGDERKVFFSSLRPPRVAVTQDSVQNGPSRDSKRGRPLYDIPYMFEAREFLRKKLIGKKVDIKVDYIKPPNDGYPERTCATVSVGGINVAEALISKGLATALRHRQDDDQRSSQYDDLLAAENRAAKNGKGLHSKKEPPIHRVADISGDAAKARQFLPFLQRAGRSSGIIEFVASGSRFRLYLPKETCLITFLLAGISCPRVRVITPQGVAVSEGEPNGDQALSFSKELCLQREVEVQVEGIDRAGNFIGWMFVENSNLSLALVEAGLSKVHFTAEKSSYYKDLCVAEEAAKNAKKGVWANFVEEVTEVVVEEVERKTNYRKVIVTEIVEGTHFWAQSAENVAQFEQLMQQLRSDLTSNPPLPGSFSPRKGDLCSGLFVDNLWYRVKVEKMASPDEVHVLYIDYGNRAKIPVTKMAALPPQFHRLNPESTGDVGGTGDSAGLVTLRGWRRVPGFAPQAQEYHLACVNLPKDADDLAALTEAFGRETLNQQYLLNVEYRAPGQEFVTLSSGEGNVDVAIGLLSEGLVMAEKRKEKRLQKLVSEYYAAQQKAKDSRLNLWRYGDFTDDDAPEFGYP